MIPPEFAPHRTETQQLGDDIVSAKGTRVTEHHTAVHPCAHPRCDDGYGNRRLTTQTMCDPCRNHYRKQLDWLVLDYVTIKATLPAPTSSGEKVRRSARQSFGHPREWASDRAALIAQVFNEHEDALRETLALKPSMNPHGNEARLINDAHRFLTDHFTDLCQSPDAADIAESISELHHQNRSALGLTRLARRLPMPCPDCETVALVQSVGQIDCHSCGRVVKEDLYPLLTRMALDTLIDEYDRARTDEETA